MIAALFVEKDGPYFGLPDVDPWDKDRDARTYRGPWAVVAHPPCERWGRYWGGSPTTWPRLTKGDDGGCFASALDAVRRWGGVLEHPEASAAWPEFGLVVPPRRGGWVAADWVHGFRGWTCCVEQGAYGHAARKATWLYLNGLDKPPLLEWKAKGSFLRLDDGFHSAEERKRAVKTGACQRLSHRQRQRTPIPFRDLLISIAEQCQPAPPTGETMDYRFKKHKYGVGKKEGRSIDGFVFDSRIEMEWYLVLKTGLCSFVKHAPGFDWSSRKTFSDQIEATCPCVGSDSCCYNECYKCRCSKSSGNPCQWHGHAVAAAMRGRVHK